MSEKNCQKSEYVDKNNNKTSKIKYNIFSFVIAIGITLIICYLFLFLGLVIKSNVGNFLISFYEHPLRVMMPTLYLTYRIRNTKFKWYDIFIALFIMLLTDFLIVIGKIL